MGVYPEFEKVADVPAFMFWGEDVKLYTEVEPFKTSTFIVAPVTFPAPIDEIIPSWTILPICDNGIFEYS